MPATRINMNIPITIPTMKLFVIVLFGLFNSLIVRSQDDSVYYAKITNTRTFMNIDRVTFTEFWFTKDKSCTLSNEVKSIVRMDKGIVWVINLRTGTFRTDPIKPSVEMSYADYPMDFKYIGQYYSPVYEWNKPKVVSSETIGNYVCEHYLCEGDADFDQIMLEYLVAKTNDQFVASRLNSTIMSFSRSSNKREPINGLITGNKSLVILRIIETVENPIAPHITTKINVDKLELIKSSEGLFDLPENLRKSN